MLHCAVGGAVGGDWAAKGVLLRDPLKLTSRRCPNSARSVGVGQRDDGVVEAGLNMGPAFWYRFRSRCRPGVRPPHPGLFSFTPFYKQLREAGQPCILLFLCLLPVSFGSLLGAVFLAGDGARAPRWSGRWSCALPAHRQAAAMADAAVAFDSIRRWMFWRTWRRRSPSTVLVVDDFAQAGDLFLGQVTHLRTRIDARLDADLPGREADAVNVAQGDVDGFSRGMSTPAIRAILAPSPGAACALVLADHANDAEAADDLALIAAGFD